MTRYAISIEEVKGGNPDKGMCPLCYALDGIETETSDPTDTTHPRYEEIDEGYSDPLCGVLCHECYNVLGKAGQHPRGRGKSDVLVRMLGEKAIRLSESDGFQMYIWAGVIWIGVIILLSWLYPFGLIGWILSW